MMWSDHCVLVRSRAVSCVVILPGRGGSWNGSWNGSCDGSCPLARLLLPCVSVLPFVFVLFFWQLPRQRAFRAARCFQLRRAVAGRGDVVAVEDEDRSTTGEVMSCYADLPHLVMIVVGLGW